MEKISAACAMSWSIELEKGLRSRKPGRPIESINLIGHRLKQWSREHELTRAVYDMYGLAPGEDRLFADAILLRLADAFVSGDKDMKMSVLRVFLSIHRYCKSKIRKPHGIFSNMSKENRLEFLRKVKVILFAENVESRVLALYLFGCCAEMVKDVAEIRLAILSTLFSCHVLEVKAALFAAGCFSEISDDFGSVLLESLLRLIISPETCPALRIAGARTFSKLRGSHILVMKSYKAGADLVGKPLEEDSLATMLISLTILSLKAFILVSDQVSLLGSFLAQNTSPRLQATVLRCIRNIGEEAAWLLPISAFPIQSLFRKLDEQSFPSVLHCEVLHILRKIVAVGLNDIQFMDSDEFTRLLRYVDDATCSPIYSIRLIAFEILVFVSNKLKEKDELMLKVNSVTFPTGVVSSISNQIALLVNLVSDGTACSEVGQGLKRMLNLLLILVKNNSELGCCILDKVQSVIKNMEYSENMPTASIQDLEVHKIVNAGAKQKFSLRVLMFYIYRFLVVLHESLNESGDITIQIVSKLKQIVSSVCENSLFDCSIHTFFTLLHTLVSRSHLLTENQSSNSMQGLSGAPSEATINGCAKNMLAGGDNWIAYKAGRYAACEGEWYVASYFFQHLVARVQSDVFSQWLNFLFQFSHSEKNIKMMPQPASCCFLLDHMLVPSAVDSSPKGLTLSEYIKKLDDAFGSISTSDKVLEGLSLQTHTFCFQRWFVALRLKVIAVLVDVLKLLNGSLGLKDVLEINRRSGGNDMEPIFQKMKDVAYSLVEASAKLASIAEEYDFMSSSFADLNFKSLKTVSALAFSCSLLACCSECTNVIVSSIVSGNLMKESVCCHSVIVKILAVRLRHIDSETFTDLMSMSKECGVHECSLHLPPKFQISKVGFVSENVLTLCRTSVKRLTGLQNKFQSAENENAVLQVYKDSMQLLLDIIVTWMQIPIQVPNYFFRVRPTAGSLLVIQSAGGSKQKEISVAQGSHLALNLCIQLKNMTSDVYSKFSKIHCILACKTSLLTRSNQRPCTEGWKDYQASETSTMMGLNRKLQCHMMKHTREFMNCEDTKSDGEIVETYACFETNGGVQGFATCLLDVSSFHTGSYRIHWLSCGVDNQGSYWSFLPLSSFPHFSVIESSKRL